MTSCQDDQIKSEEEPQKPGTETPGSFKMTVLPPEGNTYSWSENEELSAIISVNDNPSVYKLVKVAEEQNIFTAENFTPSEGVNEYHVLYPYSKDITGITNMGLISNSFGIGNTILKQTGNDNQNHIKPIFYGYASIVGNENTSINMKNVQATIKINLKNTREDDLQINNLLFAANNNTTISGNYQIGGREVITQLKLVDSGSNYVSLDVENVIIPSNESGIFYLNCVPFSMSENDILTLTINNEELCEYIVPASGLNITADQITTIEFESGEDEEVDPDDGIGSGTEIDPYIIASASTLKNISEMTNDNGTTYFSIKKDIDVSKIIWEPITFNETSTVILDGNNNRIIGLKCSSTDTPSFISSFKGTCKNLTLENATVTVTNGNTSTAGIFAAYLGDASSETIIENVNITGKLDASSIEYSNYKLSSMGALAGETKGKITIKNSHFNVEVYGPGTTGFDPSTMPGYNPMTHNIGGILGNAVSETIIESSSVKGNIKTYSNNVAGIIAYTSNWPVITLKKSSNMANIFGGSYLGGLLGRCASNATIEDCYNKGRINAVLSWNDSNVCGIIAEGGELNMKRTYNEGFIDCKQNASAGLIGAVWNGAIIEDCYTIFPEGNNPSAWETFGGIIAFCQGKVSIKNCYAAGNNISTRYQRISGIVGCYMKGALNNFSIKNCISAFNIISEDNPDNKTSAAGAIVGYCDYNDAKIEECYRSNGLVVKSSGTVVNESIYNGTKMNTNESVSDKAKDLKWDTNIWDFSNKLPKLKTNN